MDVWIDTDPAIGLPERDVDDALALVQAFRTPELVVRGVSSVFGNAPLADTDPIARELVTRFGPPGLPVARGAADAAELGADSEAVRALAAALRSRPLTILALGPLTNVATLLRRHPGLAPRIASVVAVAARRPGQELRSTAAQPEPFPDLNFECDPAAMQVLLDAGVPLALAPWEVSAHVWIDATDLDRLASAGGAGAWLAERARGWLAFWRERLCARGFNPFDTLAVGWAARPDLLRSFAARVAIEPGGGEAPPRLVARPAEAGGAGAPARYCFAPAPGFKPWLLERLTG